MTNEEKIERLLFMIEYITARVSDNIREASKDMTVIRKYQKELIKLLPYEPKY